MAIENGVFMNRLDVDRFFETWARVESERTGAWIIYRGKRLKQPTDARRSAEEAKRARVNV